MYPTVAPTVAIETNCETRLRLRTGTSRQCSARSEIGEGDARVASDPELQGRVIQRRPLDSPESLRARWPTARTCTRLPAYRRLHCGEACRRGSARLQSGPAHL